MSHSSSASPLDFAAVISRNKNLKPAALTLITPREKKVKAKASTNNNSNSNNNNIGSGSGNGINGNGTLSGVNVNVNGQAQKGKGKGKGKDGKKEGLGLGMETTAVGGSSTNGGALPDLVYAAEFESSEEARRAKDLAYNLSLRIPLKTVLASQTLRSIDRDRDRDRKSQRESQSQKEGEGGGEQEKDTSKSSHGDDTTKDQVTTADDAKTQDLHMNGNENLMGLVETLSLEERMRLEMKRRRDDDALPSQLHEVHLSDWESKINWDGVIAAGNNDGRANKNGNGNGMKHTNTNARKDEQNDVIMKDADNHKGTNVAATNALNATKTEASDAPETALSSKHKSSSDTHITSHHNNDSDFPDPKEILSERYNPSLEAIDLDNLISWQGADAPPGFNESLGSKIGKLILQDGVAGLSVATKSGAMSQMLASAHDGSFLHLTTPLPFHQSDVFKRRMELQLSGHMGSNTVGTLQKDTVKLEQEIKKRQQKRAQMAIDKTNRVKGALNKLDLGGGTGRAITSSLMGPGGTERTGRPSRQNISSLAHDSEYVEQLDIVNNHTLLKADWNVVELRHYHRPLLPRRVFKSSNIMMWQLQVKVAQSDIMAMQKRKRGGASGGSRGFGMGRGLGADGSTLVSSYEKSLMNAHKIRVGADLSPTEGSLVLFEYCEERPPLQLTKGMASKIVNYYRGSKDKIPISRGGGDRPVRKKKHGNEEESSGGAGAGAGANGSSGKIEKPPRLKGPSSEGEGVMNLIGKIPSKKKNDEHMSGRGDNEPKVTILPEGKTELLHSKDHGPFIGVIKEGVTQSGLISNLFAAPLFRHEPRSTDFLMILGKMPSRHQSEAAGSSGGANKVPVVIRPIPSSVFCVGQTEPKTKVYPPNSTGEKSFYAPFSIYQIAKALTNKQTKYMCGLKFEEITNNLFPNTDILGNALRQRIKKVAIYDKNTQIWTLKDIGYEDFQGVEALGREFSSEGVCAYVSARAARQRMEDMGIYELAVMTNAVTNVGAAMTYLNGSISAAKSRLRVLNNAVKRANQSKSPNYQSFVNAEKKLEGIYKALKRKGEVAKFIFEELQLAPWQTSTDFIDVHKKGGGSGMMKLTGLGDPSGLGAGFNFIRENDGKANKSSPNGDGALNARVKKITGTDKDLRKLNMPQMASILRSYGMPQKDIDKLKRWDRVHCIRDLSTKAASDNMGDGLERFARGEKIKLSDQRKTYRERIQEIWERQRIMLSEDPGDTEAARGAGGFGRAGEEGLDDEGENITDAQMANDKDETDDEDDDDWINEFEDNWKDTEKTNELVSNQLRSEVGDGEAFRSVSALKNAVNSQELSKDAMELAALQRQREEERAFQMDIDAVSGREAMYMGKVAIDKDRKVIRRKITKTQPDGTQTVTFKFIVAPSEVKKELANKAREKDEKGTLKGKRKKKAKAITLPRFAYRNPGHSLFEEEDDIGRIPLQGKKRRSTGRGRKSNDEDYSPRGRKSIGKGRQKTTEKKNKRKRSEEDLDLYVTSARRKGTSNRKDRGAARDRMPHVIFADRLEQIRQSCEKRPMSGPFHRPVDRQYNVYHEVIKNPIDLQTIRDKISKYEYRTSGAFLRDFQLMKDNAVLFNGVGHPLANEGTAIYEFVRETVQENRPDFDAMEAAVDEQMNSGRRGSRASTPKLPSQGGKTGKTANVTIDGITTEVALGDLQGPFQGDIL